MIELSPRDKQALVQSLWSIWNQGGAALGQLPQTIKSILDTEAWRSREVEGNTLSNATFREFVISAPLKGCGWKDQVKAIQKVLDLKSPEIAGRFRDAYEGGQGARNDLTELNDNIIKSEQGTSKSYTLSRLNRDYPKLYSRVLAGELSANAAAIKAGFRKKPKRHCPHCGHEW